LESSEFAVLHLSQAVLDKAKSGSKVRLVAKQGKDSETLIAVLTPANEMARLDLYINCTQNVQILAQSVGEGKPEVHLSGYFEPKGEDMDDDMFYGGEDDEEDDDEEEDSDEDEEVVGNKAEKKKQ